MRVLLVEDERKIASFIARTLRENAYAVDVADSGDQALEFCESTTYDAILLEVRLPRISGIHVCRELRRRGVDVPVMMLTARALIEQRVEGLDAGADDYLTKPFVLTELLARVRALIRRGVHKETRHFVTLTWNWIDANNARSVAKRRFL